MDDPEHPPVLRDPRKVKVKDCMTVTEEDNFDKLFEKLTIADKKENVDPFDQLFKNVPNQTKKKGSEISFNNHSSLTPDVSVPEEEDSTANVLFSSFSKTNLKAKPGNSRVFKPKTKSHRAKSGRSASARTKSEASAKVRVHDETLDVKMIFSESVQSPMPTPAVKMIFSESVQSPLPTPAISSLTDISPSSVNFGRSMSTLATSTPLISKYKPQGKNL